MNFTEGDIVCLKSDPDGQKFTTYSVYDKTCMIAWFDYQTSSLKGLEVAVSILEKAPVN